MERLVEAIRNGGPLEKSRAFRQRKLTVSAANCFIDQLRLYSASAEFLWKL